jgi:thiamine biosynthesis lipoprotein
MPSSLPSIERARPLLGTTVSIRVHGLSDTDAHSAIDEAFEDIALIHRLMSFHETDSDVSRLNREAADRPIEVHPATFDVLKHADEMSQTIGGMLRHHHRSALGCGGFAAITRCAPCARSASDMGRREP